jgi:hypothetical protein
MERSGGPPISPLRRPARAKGASGRSCLILVVCWALPGAAFWSRAAFVPQSPDGGMGWVYSVPSWVSLVAELAAVVLLLAWVSLPVLLLNVGLDYVRSVDRGGPWRGGWMSVVAAGIVLDALMVPLSYPYLTATPDWGAFAESLGFVAVGAAMAFVLFGAARGRTATSVASHLWGTHR